MRWILLISLTLGTIVSAQSQQAPVFRAGVDLVTMRVVVVDQKGQPVRGLAAEDFSVRLEGQVRPVRVLNYLEVDERTEVPIEARRETTTVGVTPTSPARTLPGRTFILLVDDLSFRHTSSLMQVYRRAIDNLFNQMGPADKVALVTTSGRIAPFGPTSEWAQVRARLEAIRGYFDIDDLRPEVFVSLTEAREIQNVWMWEEAAKMLADGAGLTVWRQAWDRECLLFGNLCEGTVPPPMFFALRSAALNTIAYTEQHTSIQLRGLTSALRSLSQARKSGELLTLILFSEGLGTRVSRQSDTLIRLSQTVAESGAAFYIFTGHPDDVQAAEPHMSRQRPRFEEQRDLMDGLEDLAGATGATLFRPVGTVDSTLTRILTETTGVYELAVEAPPSMTQRALSAQVSVNRRDVVVRMTRHVVSPSAPPPIISIEQELTTLVMKGGGAWSVPMTVGTMLRRDESGGGLQLGANLVFDEVAKPPFRVRVAIVDAEGRVVNSGRFVSEAHTAAFAIDMPAGPHRLRLAAADATDAVGSIEHPVVGRLTPIGRFFSSDLLLASVDPQGGAQLLVVGRLPTDAVSLSARLELYAQDVSTVTGLTVRLEVGPPGADPLETSTLPMKVDNNALVLTGQVPVTALPSGTHVVTAVVMQDGTEIGRVTSSFTKPDSAG